MASTIAAWHLLHELWVTRWLRGVIWIGSGKRPVVKASEWLKPFKALVKYLGRNPGGEPS